MKCGLLSFSLVTALFSSIAALAQSNTDDSTFYQSAISQTLAIYYKQVGDQSQIYNGSLYTGYEFKFREGTPYFFSDNFSDGSVIYDGVTYDRLSMLYDDLKELLIIRDQGYWLQLVSERISGFTIFNHQFVRLVMDSAHNNLAGTGFYEVLYPGNSMALKKTFKKIREDLSTAEGVLRYVDETHDYFIKNGNTYRRVKTKKELLDILADHKKEVQQFMRKNRLKYRKDPENTLVKTAAFYDQLTK
jgi:hypothetical protein